MFSKDLLIKYPFYAEQVHEDFVAFLQMLKNENILAYCECTEASGAAVMQEGIVAARPFCWRLSNFTKEEIQAKTRVTCNIYC